MTRLRSFVIGFVFVGLGVVLGAQVTKFPASGASYDQALNTTSNVTFASVGITSEDPVASAGDLRLTSFGTVNFRNAANDGDLAVLSINSDAITFGGLDGNALTIGATQASLSAGVGFNLTLAADNGNIAFLMTPADIGHTGYVRAETVLAAAPAAGDCDDAAETNRFAYDSTNDNLYFCSGASGWRKIATAAP